MSRRIERITLQERADWSVYESTHITFDNMRFGRPPEEVNEEASDFLRFNSGIFKEEIQLLGDALGAGIDEITTDVELVLAEHDHDIFGITLGRWHGRRPALALVRPAPRRDAGRDRDALDGRRRVPGPLAARRPTVGR